MFFHPSDMLLFISSPIPLGIASHQRQSIWGFGPCPCIVFGLATLFRQMSGLFCHLDHNPHLDLCPYDPTSSLYSPLRRLGGYSIFAALGVVHMSFPAVDSFLARPPVRVPSGVPFR